jgi:hypothetical protein
MEKNQDRTGDDQVAEEAEDHEDADMSLPPSQARVSGAQCYQQNVDNLHQIIMRYLYSAEKRGDRSLLLHSVV